jgi:hypothetical protein
MVTLISLPEMVKDSKPGEGLDSLKKIAREHLNRDRGTYSVPLRTRYVPIYLVLYHLVLLCPSEYFLPQVRTEYVLFSLCTYHVCGTYVVRT